MAHTDEGGHPETAGLERAPRAVVGYRVRRYANDWLHLGLKGWIHFDAADDDGWRTCDHAPKPISKPRALALMYMARAWERAWEKRSSDKTGAKWTFRLVKVVRRG